MSSGHSWDDNKEKKSIFGSEKLIQTHSVGSLKTEKNAKRKTYEEQRHT